MRSNEPKQILFTIHYSPFTGLIMSEAEIASHVEMGFYGG